MYCRIHQRALEASVQHTEPSSRPAASHTSYTSGTCQDSRSALLDSSRAPHSGPPSTRTPRWSPLHRAPCYPLYSARLRLHWPQRQHSTYRLGADRSNSSVSLNGHNRTARRSRPDFNTGLGNANTTYTAVADCRRGGTTIAALLHLNSLQRPPSHHPAGSHRPHQGP